MDVKVHLNVHVNGDVSKRVARAILRKYINFSAVPVLPVGTPSYLSPIH